VHSETLPRRASSRQNAQRRRLRRNRRYVRSAGLPATGDLAHSSRPRVKPFVISRLARFQLVRVSPAEQDRRGERRTGPQRAQDDCGHPQPNDDQRDHTDERERGDQHHGDPEEGLIESLVNYPRRLRRHSRALAQASNLSRSPLYDEEMSEIDFLVGSTIQEIRYSTPGNLRIVFDAGDLVEPALYADVGNCTYVDAAGIAHQIRPEDPSTVGPVLTSVGQPLDDVSTSGGTLEFRFSIGGYLRCESHEEYEAWQVVGGSPQHLVVCLPGGELAVWDDTTEVVTIEVADSEATD
jgi:hypothetical protein